MACSVSYYIVTLIKAVMSSRTVGISLIPELIQLTSARIYGSTPICFNITLKRAAIKAVNESKQRIRLEKILVKTLFYKVFISTNRKK